MPKAFDKSLLGFSSGVRGSTNSSNVSYKVYENVIIGSLENKLDSGQALTVRLTLPEDYFVGASSNTDRYSIVLIILSLVFVLIAYILWIKYGKDNKVIETVEFYPPNGLNSAEVCFLYEGGVDTEGIVSLLIYLADKGYLKIEEISNNYKQDSIKLSNEKRQTADLKIQELENKIRQEKLKDINSPKIKVLENSLQIYRNIDKPIEYELSEKEERLLNKSLKKSKESFRIVKLKDYDGNNEYEKIFFDGLFSPYSNKTSVNISDLYNNFYITLNRIRTKLNSKENINKIFESSSKGIIKCIAVMIIILTILITIKPAIDSFILLPEDMMVYSTGIISIIFLFIFIKIMPKRTTYGNEMLGKIRGFKRFLEIAEKPQLENLVEKDPQYFYNILPYTYALGVSDLWISQFETIVLQDPDWYDSTTKFNMNKLSTAMGSVYNAMSSEPSNNYGNTHESLDSSDENSSGGGSSGEGSGGGGGSSW